jgi:predicted ribosome quality control (RQC) complex YloA/Tae2 family protein
MLTALAGVPLVFDHPGALPKPVTAALPVTRSHPLDQILSGSVFSGCAMFPEDKVAAFRFINPAGEPLFLIHQLFGARLNTVLLDRQAKLLWGHHRPPHSLLSKVPPETTWDHGDPSTAPNDLSSAALEHLTTSLAVAEANTSRTSLDRKMKTARKLVENLTRDFDNAEKGELYRRRAEALAAHLHELSQGATSVTLVDPRGGGEIYIALDPALAPSANMEAWFKRARKADKGREIIAARLEDAREALEILESAGEELESVTGQDASPLEILAGLQSWQKDHAHLFPAKTKSRRGGRYGPEEPARPFRRYLVDDRWEVWVGRNNKENDELTHRASHSKDIWLHAQGVPGSHVILRTAGKPEQVPRTVLEKAAALAAQNSRARHSELVPVIFTEKRYVRKPRKALPGTAVCLREKSLFVAPGLAPGVVSI